MGLREIAKTVLMLEKEDRTFGAVKQSEYNEEKERSKKDGDHLYDDKRVQIPDIKVLETEETELGVWAMRRKDYLQKEKRTVYYNLLTSCKLSEHLQQIEREAEEMMQMLTDQMKVKEKISEELKEKSPMQWTAGDEQYQTESKGDRTEGTHIQLAYFDRGAEDRSLPFFHIDKVAEAVRSFFDENTLQEIELFYKENSDEGSRISFLKEKFSGLPEKEALGYGCKLYSNVLFLYEGEQEIPQSGAYYDWRVIEECLEGLMLTGAFYSEIDPRSFTFSQEIIDIALTSGSLYENGKFRIYEQFQRAFQSRRI